MKRGSIPVVLVAFAAIACGTSACATPTNAIYIMNKSHTAVACKTRFENGTTATWTVGFPMEWRIPAKQAVVLCDGVGNARAGLSVRAGQRYFLIRCRSGDACVPECAGTTCFVRSADD